MKQRAVSGSVVTAVVSAIVRNAVPPDVAFVTWPGKACRCARESPPSGVRRRRSEQTLDERCRVRQPGDHHGGSRACRRYIIPPHGDQACRIGAALGMHVLKRSCRVIRMQRSIVMVVVVGILPMQNSVTRLFGILQNCARDGR